MGRLNNGDKAKRVCFNASSFCFSAIIWLKSHSVNSFRNRRKILGKLVGETKIL